MGKKQFAILLVLHILGHATSKDVRRALQQPDNMIDGISTMMKKLTEKKLLVIEQIRHRNVYHLSPAGVLEMRGFTTVACKECLTMAMARALYGIR